MASTFDRLQRWSWHQSHDQATVLLLVPADLAEDELSVRVSSFGVDSDLLTLGIGPRRFISMRGTSSLPFVTKPLL